MNGISALSPRTKDTSIENLVGFNEYLRDKGLRESTIETKTKIMRMLSNRFNARVTRTSVSGAAIFLHSSPIYLVAASEVFGFNKRMRDMALVPNSHPADHVRLYGVPVYFYS